MCFLISPLVGFMQFFYYLSSLGNFYSFSDDIIMKSRKHVCLMSGFVSIFQFLPELPEFLYATFDAVGKHCPVFFFCLELFFAHF